MKLNYFTNCQTLAELKQQYKELLIKFHPDNNNNSQNSITKTQEINNQYDVYFQKLKFIHKNAKGEFYQKDTGESVNEFKDIMDIIVNFHNVKIEIIGSWIWVSMETKPYREQLKKLGFRWSRNKSSWYYTKTKYRKRSKKNFTLNDIRNMYGTEEVKTREKDLIYNY